MNRVIIFGFICLALSSVLTILFIPQFEFPDGTHHYVKIILNEEQRINLHGIDNILRNLIDEFPRPKLKYFFLSNKLIFLR